MFCNQVTINMKKKDEEIHLRPLGDIHIGNIGCDLDKFQKSIDWVCGGTNRFTIGMGDYIDNVMAFANGGIDKRWNPETVNRDTLTTEEQIDKFIAMWKQIPTPTLKRAWTGNGTNKKPLSHKSWGLLAGNHEWKTINQRRFVKDFCEPLGINYLGRSAFVNVSFKYNNKQVCDYVLYVLHGGYGGGTAGGSLNRMNSIASNFDADIILMGHNHDTVCRKVIRTGYDKKTNSLYERDIILGNTGTFLRGYMKGVDSYIEANPKEAKSVGTITLTFKPDEGKFYAHE